MEKKTTRLPRDENNWPGGVEKGADHKVQGKKRKVKRRLLRGLGGGPVEITQPTFKRAVLVGRGAASSTRACLIGGKGQRGLQKENMPKREEKRPLKKRSVKDKNP